MKRTTVLLAMLVAVVLVLYAPMAEAKKKHKKKHRGSPAFNTVQCPTGDDGVTCQGTPANDFLKGGPENREPNGAFDLILGAEGTDVYNGGNGSDFLFDDSTTSSDVYLFPATEFSGNFGFSATVDDDGGNGDIVYLSSYSIDGFDVSKVEDALNLDGPGERYIIIRESFGAGEIELFLFREGSFTGDQVASRAREATTEEQAALKERLLEDEHSVQSVDFPQESKRSRPPDAAAWSRP